MVQLATDRNFRKVDIDKYDENAYVEEAQTSTVSFEESDVNSAILSSDYSKAIKLMCSSCVLCTDEREPKEKLVEAFFRVTTSVKANSIDDILKALSNDEKDALIKIIYLSFALKSDADHAPTHNWFQKLFQTPNHGAILRAMTDRKALVIK